MHPLLDSLAGQFRTTHILMPMVLGDLSQEAAIRRSRGEQGPSILWTVGHMLDYRCMLLGVLGKERHHAFEEVFRNRSATDGTDYPPLSAVMHEWNEVHKDVEQALAEADVEEVARKSEQAGVFGERPLDALTFFAWHEAYHFGAIGAERKAQGLPGPAELVMAAREEGKPVHG